MSDERTELLDQANELGLEFPSNIPTVKLKEMVDDAAGPAIKEDPKEDQTNESTEAILEKVTEKIAKRKLTAQEEAHNSLRERIKVAKQKAMKKSVVTITNKDNRENDVMTTVQVSFENQYFGMSKDIPLDIPVEVEHALIDILEGTSMTLHKDEIINGKRTGNKVPVSTKKFAISYNQKQD